MDSSKVTCKVCNKAKPTTAYFPSKLAAKRCIDCIRLSRQRVVNSSPTKYLTRSAQQLKHGRVKKGYKWTIDNEYIINLWHQQDGKCAVSGLNMTHHRGAYNKKMPLNASIVRINNAEHYVPGNIQLVCYQVNIMRHVLDVGEFEWWIRTIYEKQNQF